MLDFLYLRNGVLKTSNATALFDLARYFVIDQLIQKADKFIAQDIKWSWDQIFGNGISNDKVADAKLKLRTYLQHAQIVPVGVLVVKFMAAKLSATRVRLISKDFWLVKEAKAQFWLCVGENIKPDDTDTQRHFGDLIAAWCKYQTEVDAQCPIVRKLLSRDILRRVTLDMARVLPKLTYRGDVSGLLKRCDRVRGCRGCRTGLCGCGSLAHRSGAERACRSPIQSGCPLPQRAGCNTK